MRIVVLAFLTLIYTKNDKQIDTVGKLYNQSSKSQFDKNAALNAKLRKQEFVDDKIDCKFLHICQLCNSTTAYQITPNNIHLLAVHYGVKAEIK